MRVKLISILIGIVLASAVGFLVYSQKEVKFSPSPVPAGGAETEKINNETATPNNSEGVTGIIPSPVSEDMILSQVAEHAARENCWTIINGNVYNLTSWIPNHPGGETAILQLCGKDGSQKFNGKHGGVAKQAAVLAGFKIGALDQ